jgi:histidine triad (HIT) family protein
LNTNQTIFHKIINREVPADIIFEDSKVIAFRDISPISPEHILIVPKASISKLSDADIKDEALLGHMLLVAKDVAIKLGFADDGFRVVINSGEKAGQTVFQLHMHLLGGRDFSWPPG